MEKNKNNKTKWLHLRLSEAEDKRLNSQFKKTTCRKRSDYARKILLGDPVVALQRNQSLDDFVTELTRLKNELKAVGNNINQVARKINSVDKTPEVIRLVTSLQTDQTALINCLDAIEKHAAKLSDQWLQ